MIGCLIETVYKGKRIKAVKNGERVNGSIFIWFKANYTPIYVYDYNILENNPQNNQYNLVCFWCGQITQERIYNLKKYTYMFSYCPKCLR